MITAVSGYATIYRVIIICFVLAFGIFSLLTYFVIRQNIAEETFSAMSQAKAMQQQQVSVEAMQAILSQSPHLQVQRFFGRLNEGLLNGFKSSSESALFVNSIEPIIMPLSENSYLVISADNESEFNQNIHFFYLVLILFSCTLAMLLLAIRMGIRHQLKPLKQLAAALKNTIVDESITTKASNLPASGIAEIQSVINEYKQLKQSLNKKEEELLSAEKKLAMLQEDERTYLARELHDNMGQLITSTKAYAHILVNTQDIDVVKQSAQKIKDFCQQISHAIRELTNRLHPLVLDKVTLWEAVARLISEQRGSQPEVNWKIDLPSETYTDNRERDVHIYRIIQESINNIIKHAHASNVVIQVFSENKKMHINIKDDGVGFSDDSPLGLGLSSMKSRARCIGACLTIHSSNAGGTHVHLILDESEMLLL